MTNIGISLVQCSQLEGDLAMIDNRLIVKLYQSIIFPMMRSIYKPLVAVISFLILLAYSTTITANSQAQNNFQSEYYRAKVISQRVVEPNPESTVRYAGEEQKLTIELLEGPDEGEEIEIVTNLLVRTGDDRLLEKGEDIIVIKNPSEVGEEYFLYGRYRLNAIYLWLFLFVLLIISFSRRQGLFSILGLAVGVLIIFWYMLPQISNGGNTLIVIFTGVIIAAFTSLYLAHGFNKRTTIALLSTLITLGFAVITSYIAVRMVSLSGAGTEEAFYLQYNEQLANINLQGLFLGGVMIGTLGVLDDITTAQVAVVSELKRANNSLGFKELYNRSLSVGREHIASLVNTLAFAYIGASFPTFLSYIYATNVPWYILLNSDQIVEEIIQTLVGSSALVIAVPVSSFLAAKWFAKHPPKEKVHAHVH